MKLLIAGDFCPRYRVVEKFEKGDYESVLGEVKEIISDADYSIVNFECPVTNGGEKPIEKCGPNLRCSEKGIEAVKWVGFDCVTLANNHFLDYGKEGVEHTLEACKRYGIDTVGGGMSLQEASKILYKKIEDNTLAIINCCEHEYSIATETTAGANPLNPIQQYYAIKDARGKADYVLVIVHGGHEHYNLPSPRMQEVYRFFIDAGADAVVNHHQHCYSGYELYKNRPIFYGIGNFCFDKIHDGLPASWHEGYLVELSFCNTDDISFKLIPYSQCTNAPSVKQMNGELYDAFIKNVEKLNKIISNPNQLKKKHEEWMEASGSGFEHQYLPYSNRWLISAHIRHIFPSFLSKQKLLVLQNHFECESHRERSLFALNKLIRNKNL